MISFKDYTLPDGNTDWAAYRKAQINAGEYCEKCENYIHSYEYPGYRQECYSCKTLKKNEEVNHEQFIRCPSCGEEEDVHYQSEDYTIFHDGDHDIECPECNHKYMITTYVSYDFRSPARIEKKNEEED